MYRVTKYYGSVVSVQCGDAGARQCSFVVSQRAAIALLREAHLITNSSRTENLSPTCASLCTPCWEAGTCRGSKPDRRRLLCRVKRDAERRLPGHNSDARFTHRDEQR